MALHPLLLVVIAALLPSYLLRLSLFGMPTNFLEVIIALAFLSGLLSPEVRQTWLRATPSLPKPILVSSFLFLVSALVSTLISPHLETSLGILKGWILFPMLYGLMVYASLQIPSSSPLSRGEQLQDSSLDKGRLGGIIIRALVLSGLVMALLGLSQIGLQDRISGVYDVPNSLALFLAPLIALAILLPLTKGESPSVSEGRGWWIAAVVMFLALLLTQSLAGVLSVLAIVSFLVIKKLDIHWSLVIGSWSLIIALFFLPKINYLLQPNSSAAVRLQLWSISWELIKEHPVLGTGLGTFEPAYQQKLHERFAADEKALPEFVFRDPHSWPLSFWLNTGLLGLISFAFLNGYVIFWTLKNWTFIGHWSLVIGISGAIISLLLFGLVDTIYWKNDLSTLHFLLLSLITTKTVVKNKFLLNS